MLGYIYVKITEPKRRFTPGTSKKPMPHPARHSGKTLKLRGKATKNKPRKQAVANFRLNTGHDCLAAHLLAHQNPQPRLLHNMQTEEQNNGQRPPPCVPKTRPYF
jgi:hypothetical protein